MKSSSKSSQAENLFLALLKSAIWNQEPDISFFHNVDRSVWNKIQWLAYQQGVSAMIADRILLLPSEHLPDDNWVVNQMRIIKECVQLNNQMTQTLIFILNKYDEQEIPAILLKGHGNAQAYPNPKLRSPGDIDLFLFKEEDYDKANQWVKDQGYTYHVDDRDGHRAFEVNGIIVENHKRITFFSNDKYNKLLLEKIEDFTTKKQFEKISIQGVDVLTLPPELNALYIFQHFFFHFIHEGVGFRQYIDWLLYLSKYREVINSSRFTELSKSFGLLLPMQIFAETAINYLDAPKSIFPFPLNGGSKYPHLIIKDILSGGNFGFHHPVYQKSDKKWGRRWYKIKRIIRRTYQFQGISPEYIRPIPFEYIIYRAKKTLGLRTN